MRHGRRAAWLGLALAATLVAGVFGAELRRVRRLVAGLAAKQTCTCVFVHGRDFEACRRDLPPAPHEVPLAVDEGARTVRAGIPLVTERIARYRDDTGCALQ